MSEHGYKTRDATFEALPANFIATGLMIPVAALFLIPHILLWGISLNFALPPLGFVLLIIIIMVSTVAHEALHGVGMLLGGVKLPDIKFGVLWHAMTPYAHCKVPVQASHYRWIVALPGLVLGVIPGLLGLVTGKFGLTAYGAFMTMAAMGDALILWVIRDVPGHQRVLDHPSKVGCEIILEDEPSTPPL